MFKGKLISCGNNAKTVKGDGSEYLTAIMYLAPADIVDGINLCPFAAKAGCTSACLYSSGRGQMTNVQEARIRKTIMYRDQRELFMATLVKDIERFVNYCAKRNIKPVVRLNGTSDILWERKHPVIKDGHTFASIMDAFPNVQFYDYTKVYKRAYADLPSNYDLTLSYSEANKDYAHQVMEAHQETGTNVAIVYRSKEYATQQIINNPFIINGDKDDLRFLDPKTVIVALYAKGSAKKDTTGFVVG